jgi:hypothetical protein
MHIDTSISFREAPGGTGVIEMNMAQENMANVLQGEAGFAKIDNYIFESRFCAGIEERDAVLRFESSGCDNAWSSEVPCIKNVNRQSENRLFILRAAANFERSKLKVQ